jgi:TatA/E family protein of Tat protein translocase
MIGSLGGPELFLIFLVALVVFGPRKLPELGKSLGKMVGEFKRASNEFRQTLESEVEAEKIREAARIDVPNLLSVPEPAPRTAAHGAASGDTAPVEVVPAAAPETSPVTEEAAAAPALSPAAPNEPRVSREDRASSDPSTPY